MTADTPLARSIRDFALRVGDKMACDLGDRHMVQLLAAARIVGKFEEAYPGLRPPVIGDRGD